MRHFRNGIDGVCCAESSTASDNAKVCDWDEDGVGCVDHDDIAVLDT